MASGLIELRLGLRMIGRRPLFAAAVVLPIALAIAITCALFSVMDGLLFRPLPFREPARLVAVDFRRLAGELPELAYSRHLQPQRETLRSALETSSLIVEAVGAGSTALLEPGAREVGIETTGVDSRFFRLLGLRPALGRDFAADDERDPASPASRVGIPVTVIISHSLWQSMFGGSPHVVGVQEIAGHRVRIAGVMGPGVKFPGETDVWVAVRLKDRPPTYARMAPEATVEQLAARFPELAITPLANAIRPGGAQAMLVLFAAAAVLLLVSWVQVAGLVFSGAIGRVHEIGVRSALGAGPLALARQFAIENALLAGAAFVLAWVAVPPLTVFLIRTMPAELTVGQYLTPDARTFFFACAASILGLALLTAVPMVAIRRASPVPLLQGRLGPLPFAAERLRRSLLVVQVTLTALLLYVAGLMVHSFVRVASFDYGFDSRNVLLFTPPTPIVGDVATLGTDRVVDARLEEKQRRIAASLERLGGLPGVTAVASFSSVPLVTQGSRLWTSVPGRPREHWEEIFAFDGRPVSPRLGASGSVVSRNFIGALGATLVAGSGFDDPAYRGAEDVMVINETLAKQLAPASRVGGSEIYVSLLGRTVKTTWTTGRIAGVMKNMVYSTPSDAAVPQFFVPSPSARPFGVIVIRTSPSVTAVLPAIETVLRGIWGDLPPKHFGELRDAWHAGLKPFRGRAVLISVIAAFCIPLAVVGLMGALLYSVQLRTREMGIRISLGADPRTVRRAVVRTALLTVSLGLLIGTLLGVAAGRAVSNQLFNVHAVDAWTMVAVVSGLLALAWLAALIPARRVSRLDPAAVLRAE